jgi:hypothetical protein
MHIAATVAILITLLARAECRVGNDQDRRRLEHRKLQWAEAEVAIPQQYLIVLDDFSASEIDFDIYDYVNDWLGGDFGEAEVVLEYGTIYKGLVMKNVPLYTLKNIVEDERVAYVTEVSVVGRNSSESLSCTPCISHTLYLGRTSTYMRQSKSKVTLRGDWTVLIRCPFLSIKSFRTDRMDLVSKLTFWILVFGRHIVNSKDASPVATTLLQSRLQIAKMIVDMVHTSQVPLPV